MVGTSAGVTLSSASDPSGLTDASSKDPVASMTMQLTFTPWVRRIKNTSHVTELAPGRAIAYRQRTASQHVIHGPFHQSRLVSS
jgi:hypothetical protein